MKKALFFLSFITLCSFLGSAQIVWNKKLPTSTVLSGFSELHYANGDYWINTDRVLTQVNETGNIIGQLTQTIGFSNLWLYGTKVNNPLGNNPYYLLARLTSISSGGYTIAHYRPGEGIISQMDFVDTFSSITQTRGPVFVKTDEHTLLVFGHKAIRKIQHQVDGTLSELWAKPLVFKANDALWTGNQAIFCDALGNFKAIDSDGNLLWEKAHPFSSKSIKMVADGIIGCGIAGTGEGTVFKLDFNGNLLWSKTLAQIKLNDLTPVTDGGILLTGETDASNWFLIKTDGLGNTLWEKTYEKGRGWDIEPAADGGAVVLWLVNGGGVNLARVDAQGNTSALDKSPAQLGERTLRNSSLNATQFPFTGLFFDGTSSRLRAPADSSTSPVFVSSPWIAGLDGAANLHVAAAIYENANSDFRSGIATGNSIDFDRVWGVSRAEIASIRKDFGADGDLDLIPPHDLLTWPAKGNPHFKQNLDFSLVTSNPDSLPAPFIDANGDGIYNVFDGDYPKLKGDRMLWWARTDQTVHTESNGQPMGIDLFITLYGYDCPSNEGIGQSVFAEYQMVNRSGETYFNTYWGQFTDFDLGCSDDDYVGNLPEANSSYVYNSDMVDGQPASNCAGGVSTYGENLPIESITMLNHSLDFGTYSNRGGGPSNPSNPFEFYSELKGLVCDGLLPTVGGDGCTPGNTNFTNYVFPDNPADPQGWSMCNENLPLGDRRVLNSHGPFTFAAGDTFSMRLAFTFHPDIPHPCPDIFGLVKPTLLEIQQWHDDGTLDASLDLGSVLSLQTGQSLPLDATVPNATGYFWSTGATTASISVTQTGEYTVTVTRASGCDIVESVLVKSATSTNSPTLPAWKLQPNPASELLYIYLEEAGTNAQIMLRNAQGQVVSSIKSSSNPVEIPVAQLPSGLYWAELWQDGLFLGSRKVVVAK